MGDSLSFGRAQRVMQPGDEDQRYRISVILMADKRPKYWEFHCNSCGSKICELSGDLVGLHDVADVNAIPDYEPAPVAFRCGGRYCRFWYEFVTLAK